MLRTHQRGELNARHARRFSQPSAGLWKRSRWQRSQRVRERNCSGRGGKEKATEAQSHRRAFPKRGGPWGQDRTAPQASAGASALFRAGAARGPGPHGWLHAQVLLRLMVQTCVRAGKPGEHPLCKCHLESRSCHKGPRGRTRGQGRAGP